MNVVFFPVMSLMMSFVLSISHEMSWMRSGTELNQFLRFSYLLFSVFRRP